MLDTPVLFVIFNRIDTTKKVFEAIRTAGPKKLFISADGPRVSKDGEAVRCKEVRKFVLDNIDWDCEVKTLFREKNLGSGPAVYDAINWFFSLNEYGIILEDDCLPDNSFFQYAEKVLELYKDDLRIMHVSGCNLQCGIMRGEASYYFSQIPATWGWATWKRAWEKYSFDFFQDGDTEIIDTIGRTVKNKEDVKHFFNEIQATKSKTISAWDYQWFYALLKFNGLSVTPQFNLIRNLGFNFQGTHTFSEPYWYKYLVNKPIRPICLATEIAVNVKADFFYFALTMGRRTVETSYVKIMYKIKKMFNVA